MGLKVWGFIYFTFIWFLSSVNFLKGTTALAEHPVTCVPFGCFEGRLFDGFEVVISYWSLYHTAHISKISLQCCPHSKCWGLRHDWSPSYTGHIYTDPPWGGWAHQRKGGALIEALSTHLTSVGFLPWVGSLVGLHMWALTQALLTLTTHTGLLSYLQLLLKFKITAKVDAFSILIRGLTFWVDDAMLGCVPHKVFSTIIVARCHLAFVYFLITMVMRDHSHDAMITQPQFIFYVNLLIHTLIILTLSDSFSSRNLRRSEFVVLDCWHYWNSSLEAFPHSSHLQQPQQILLPTPDRRNQLVSVIWTCCFADLLLSPG